MITSSILNFIKNKSLIDLPHETCGFITENNNRIHCIPMKNTALDSRKTFRIQTVDFLKIKRKYEKIWYIYHSHTDRLNKFSELDIKASNMILIPFILYCVGEDKFSFYYPEGGNYDQSKSSW